jgi:Replication-relaxation
MASQSPVPRRARGGAADDQAVLKAAARLTERDRYLVRTVAEHRVLTTDQVAALAFDNIITARHRLDALARLGALNRFRPHRATGSAPWHYLLGPLGAVLLGAEDRDDRKWLPQVRSGRQVALQRSQRLAHMIGDQLVLRRTRRPRPPRRRGTADLADRNRTAELFYQYPFSLSALASLPQPDGAGVWADGGREIAFVLEYAPAANTWPNWRASLTATPDWPTSCLATTSRCRCRPALTCTYLVAGAGFEPATSGL